MSEEELRAVEVEHRLAGSDCLVCHGTGNDGFSGVYPDDTCWSCDGTGTGPDLVW
jgi:hypothetical protein